MSDKGQLIGRVAYSTAGRDKKRPFVVVGVMPDGSLLIADGRFRTLERPKRKNVAHLCMTDIRFEAKSLCNDALREFLKKY